MFYTINFFLLPSIFFFFFFFNDTATTEIYTLSLHDALPICRGCGVDISPIAIAAVRDLGFDAQVTVLRSEEHTSELQSHHDLVCRLLLEKKKKKIYMLFCFRVYLMYMLQ